MKKPRKIRPRRLQLETLERREVMTAGLTATLSSSGVLTVTGTSGNDDINFHQSSGVISIEDVAKTFSASKVKSIVVDLGAGNDLVSLNSLANGGAQTLAEKVTVRSGAGNESVELMNGQMINFADAGHTLIVQANGSASLDNYYVNLSNSIHISLVNGVLTALGTNSGDNIRFIQNDGWLGVVGGSQWFSAAKVNSIVVNLQDGNDTVSFDSLYCGCNQSITAALTVNFGMGTETVRLPDGTEGTYSGFGHQLTYVNGVAKLNGVVINTNTVQMSFVNGVLTVSGTTAADTLKFIQNNGWLGIQGGSQWFQASTVTSIVVNANGGDDTVSFDSIQNGCNQAITAALTVNGNSGNDSVRMPNGFVTTLAAGNTLTYAGGVTKLNGVTINAPDAVVMSFVNGVLTVTAKSGNDNLKLIQNDGWLGIVGGSQWYQASSVTSIIVNLQGGTDSVSLDSILNGCNQAIAAPITVNSTDGNKQVRCPNGNTASFSGSHQLIVAANGAVTLDGVELWPAPQPDPEPEPEPDPDPQPDPDPDPDPQPQNWFDANVQDAALRSLGSSLYADGLVDRSDIIALLQDARDGSVIDATELADLRAIAANATLFGTGAHVQALTNYVVNDTVANAKYKGATLGNLTAGSTSGQMDKLISKWFLGIDRPTASGSYRQTAGQLFVNGATYGDIKQGSVGDCYFVASLAEVAHRSPSIISNMFVTNGDGTYTVKFFNQGTQYFITVDSYLPSNSNGYLLYAGVGAVYSNASNELWVSLAEKAYVQLNEFGFTRPGLPGSGQNAYSAIAGGYIYAALHNITGQNTTAFAMTSGSTSFTTFVNAYNAGKMIGFASYATTPAGSGVVGGHAYAVVGYDATNQTVTLFNPWGTSYGLLTLTWTQVQASFQYFDRTA